MDDRLWKRLAPKSENLHPFLWEAVDHFNANVASIQLLWHSSLAIVWCCIRHNETTETGVVVKPPRLTLWVCQVLGFVFFEAGL